MPANVVVRSLTFEDTATALMLQNITNGLTENCRFHNNGYSGLGVSGDRLTVRGCRFEDNGSIGFGADGDGILIEDCLTARNCAKGHAYGWDGWDSGGFKCGGLTRSTVRRLTAIGNFTKGLWSDTACLGDLVEDCTALGNSGDGVFWENNNRNTVRRLNAQVTDLLRRCRFAPSWSDQLLPGLRLDSVYNTDHNRYYSPRPAPFRDASGKEALTFAAWQALQDARGHANRHSVFLSRDPSGGGD